MRNVRTGTGIGARLQAFLSGSRIFGFFAVYAIVLFCITLVQYADLLLSSLALGHLETAFGVLVASAADAYSGDLGVALSAALALISVDTVLLYVYLKSVTSAVGLAKPAGLGAAGALALILGLGCLSCGAVLATYLVALLGTSSLPAISAWGGNAFLIISLALFVLLSAYLFKKATDPLVC
ncbi:MAG: hypothetical protein EPO65_13960 [Dehalococcoidia bacterium]|nr:MAG: hypothetical protein EPO65_13960 [Dehalococcoidia bacterium]